MRLNKEMLLLYGVTDRRSSDVQGFMQQIESALRGGVTMLQLREKQTDDEILLNLAIQVKELCHSYDVPFIVNDRWDIALKCGADGVHVGIEDAPVAEIRKVFGPDLIIGATAKTIEQAKAAEEAGADYLGVGAVFPSPTKSNAVRITRDDLDEICQAVSIPVVAIGGITYDNMDIFCGAKINGVAMVSAIFGAEDIEKETKKIKEKLSNFVSK